MLEWLDLILTWPAYPINLSFSPKPTTLGVYLKLASFVIIYTPPLRTAAILTAEDPRSSPVTVRLVFVLILTDRKYLYKIHWPVFIKSIEKSSEYQNFLELKIVTNKGKYK